MNDKPPRMEALKSASRSEQENRRQRIRISGRLDDTEPQGPRWVVILMRAFLLLVGLGIMILGIILVSVGWEPVDWGMLLAGAILAFGGALLAIWGLTSNGKDACAAAVVFLRWP